MLTELVQWINMIFLLLSSFMAIPLETIHILRNHLGGDGKVQQGSKYDNLTFFRLSLRGGGGCLEGVQK